MVLSAQGVKNLSRWHYVSNSRPAGKNVHVLLGHEPGGGSTAVEEDGELADSDQTQTPRAVGDSTRPLSLTLSIQSRNLRSPFTSILQYQKTSREFSFKALPHLLAKSTSNSKPPTLEMAQPLKTSGQLRTTSHGRGGAGNINSKPSTHIGADDLTTPTIKSATYSTGRGGNTRYPPATLSPHI